MDESIKVKIAIADAVITSLWTRNLIDNQEYEKMKERSRSMIQKAA